MFWPLTIIVSVAWESAQMVWLCALEVGILCSRSGHKCECQRKSEFNVLTIDKKDF